MNAGTLCTQKVSTVLPEDTLRVAAQRMVRQSVGTLVVVDPRTEGRDAIGIITDRDLVTRGVAAGLNPEISRVAMVMSLPIQSVREDTPIEEALDKMSRRGIRRLVVKDSEGSLSGILSLDDILESLADDVSLIGRVLEKHAPIYG